MKQTGKCWQNVRMLCGRRGHTLAHGGTAAKDIPKPNTDAFPTRDYIGLLGQLLVGLIIVIQPNSVFATEVPDGNLDYIDFFKRSVMSPPDVEYFIATQQPVKSGTVSPQVRAQLASRGLDPDATMAIAPYHFAGAFSGSNFFVVLGDTNSGNTTGLASKQPILGRAGTNTYEVGIKTLTQTFEDANSHQSNPIAQWSASQYRLVVQLLRMGVGGVRLGTLTWTDNGFLAESGSGVLIIGKLIISNNLPYRLELGKAGTSEAYAVLIYEYPTPPSSLAGYPRIINRMSKRGDEREVQSRLIIEKMSLAKSPLPEEFFSKKRFLTSNHVFQTLFSNGAYYASLPDGRTKRFVDFGERRNRRNNNLVRGLIVASLCTVTLAFLVFLARSWKYKKQT